MALYALPLKKHQQQPWHSVQKTCFVSVILDFTDSQEEYHYSTSHIVEKIALIFPQIMTIIITYAIVAVDVSLRWLCCHVTKYFYLHSGLLITTRLLDGLYLPHRLILIRYIYIILIIFFTRLLVVAAGELGLNKQVVVYTSSRDSRQYSGSTSPLLHLISI